MPKYKKRRHIEGQLGMFGPASDWTPPACLPDLTGRPVVVLDCETKDQGLIDGKGPGWAFAGRNGYICGVSWAAEGSSGYAPMLHPETENFTPDQVMRWVTALARNGTKLLFHSAAYDYGWLTLAGAALTGAQINDTLAACVLTDETEYSYGLDDCCKRVGLPGKDTQLLKNAVEAAGHDPKKAREFIWDLPARFAAPYAEADAVQTLGLWRATEPLLAAQNLTDAYVTEMGLVPMVVAMRRRGIRLDLDRLHRLIAELGARRDAALAEVGELLELKRAASMTEIRSPKQMSIWFERERINFPLTIKAKQGSFTKDWMEKHEHPLPRACATAELFEEAITKFLKNYLLGYADDGRIHAEIHQYRDTTGGTRSHRFSYSEPPLQQMPSPDKPGDLGAIGKAIRGCFLPEEGERWVALDYSQQEPRLTVHFASKVGAEGAEAAVQRYIENPRTDYHQMVAEMTNRPRPVAKILNLSMTYGKGKRALADELGVSLIEAEGILEDYHNRLPFIKSLEDKCRNAASQRGYIRLIDGARMHYPQWEGGYLDPYVRSDAEMRGKKVTPCDLATAQERQADPDHPWFQDRLRRADTRKSLNNLIQGSAARQTKRAMLAVWREGIVPLIQLHDELGISTPDRAVALRVQQIMVETTPLVVPTIVDLEAGPTWGEAKEEWHA
jgi:DNA polymerase I-like protein with 3'-5' exonuclease and polymerase domains